MKGLLAQQGELCLLGFTQTCMLLNFLFVYTSALRKMYRLPGALLWNDHQQQQPMLVAMISLVVDIIVVAKQPLMTSCWKMMPSKLMHSSSPWTC